MKLTKYQRIRNLYKTLRTQQEEIDGLRLLVLSERRKVLVKQSRVEKVEKELKKIREASLCDDPFMEYLTVQYRVSKHTLKYIRDPEIIWNGLHEQLCQLLLESR